MLAPTGMGRAASEPSRRPMMTGRLPALNVLAPLKIQAPSCLTSPLLSSAHPTSPSSPASVLPSYGCPAQGFLLLVHPPRLPPPSALPCRILQDTKHWQVGAASPASVQNLEVSIKRRLHHEFHVHVISYGLLLHHGRCQREGVHLFEEAGNRSENTNSLGISLGRGQQQTREASP